MMTRSRLASARLSHLQLLWPAGPYSSPPGMSPGTSDKNHLITDWHSAKKTPFCHSRLGLQACTWGGVSLTLRPLPTPMPFWSQSELTATCSESAGSHWDREAGRKQGSRQGIWGNPGQKACRRVPFEISSLPNVLPPQIGLDHTRSCCVSGGGIFSQRSQTRILPSSRPAQPWRLRLQPGEWRE